MSEKCEKYTSMTTNSSSSKSVETGSSSSLKRVRSPTPLEYALDHPVPSFSKGHQGSLTSCEGSSNYSKWVSSNYFGKMVEWVADVNLGKPLSDDKEAWSQFGIGWAEEAVRAEAKAHQDFKDGEIEALVDTHTSPVPCCG